MYEQGHEKGTYEYDEENKTIKITASDTGSVHVEVRGLYSSRLTDVEASEWVKFNPKEIEVSAIANETNEDIELQRGQVYTLSPILTQSGATNANLTFASFDEKVATVNGNGIVEAAGIGEADITVASKADPEVKAVYHIVVTPSEIAFTEDMVTVRLGEWFNIYDYLENVTKEDQLKFEVKAINSGKQLGYDRETGNVNIVDDYGYVGYYQVTIISSEAYVGVDDLIVLVLPSEDDIAYQTLAELNASGHTQNTPAFFKTEVVGKYDDKYLVLADATGGVRTSVAAEVYNMFEVGDTVGFFLYNMNFKANAFKAINRTAETPFLI